MTLKSVAIQVCRMEAMTAFYSQAFGIRFRPVEVSGLPCQFGDWAGLELKLVPLRTEVDFDNYPVHQLGAEVSDPEEVQRLSLSLGGRPEGALAVRDPDGNTIELTRKETRETDLGQAGGATFSTAGTTR